MEKAGTRIRETSDSNRPKVVFGLATQIEVRDQLISSQIGFELNLVLFELVWIYRPTHHPALYDLYRWKGKVLIRRDD